MIRGVDTTFLVHLEAENSQFHEAAGRFLEKEVLEPGHVLAIAPQVLMEFAPVVTDGQRFEKELTMRVALDRADSWWHAKETRQVYPNCWSILLFFDWMNRLNLGRKRILHTYLAATYVSNNITEIISCNVGDYSILSGITVVDYTG